jgi:DNA repair protein RadA/Sms
MLAHVAKSKRSYDCEACGSRFSQWQGQCPDCGGWNTLTELRDISARAERSHYAGDVQFSRLSEVAVEKVSRLATGFGELDRVLGGGLVPGSVVLIGGDPGIGKSTLLLRALADMSAAGPACYVSGEESLDQIGLRARRLGVGTAPVELLAETRVERILAGLEQRPPAVLVIDSIQTLYSEALQAAPGSVSQLRECAAQLVRFAKTRNTAAVLVGHVTKEGMLAGPRVLEHMVDTVLYFESDLGSRFRIIRATKNRFGAANEMGFFVMESGGFKEVKNPSAIFLARRNEPVSGSVTLVTREGTRPVLVEVQALVDQVGSHTPRRVAQGLDGQRLGMLLAVLHRHCGIALGDCDIFANVVGGLKVSETAADLAVSLACLSSFRERPIDPKLIVFGEVGLTGEIRPVPFGEERIAEAAKHGFKTAIVPMANTPRNTAEIAVIGVERLGQVLEHVQKE